MKKHLHLAALISLLSFTFNLSPVKAEPNHREPQRGSGTATCLPINNNVIYLLVAGVAIGVVSVVRRKSLKANQ